jgi:hypothetical protein
VTFTYDLSGDIGRVRLMVPDRDPDAPIFEDDELSAFLAIEGDVKLAAALALETVASDTAMTLQWIKAGSVQLDGQKASDAVLSRAALLRAQVEMVDPTTGGAYTGFDVAEMVTGPFGYRERLGNEALRGG